MLVARIRVFSTSIVLWVKTPVCFPAVYTIIDEHAIAEQCSCHARLSEARAAAGMALHGTGLKEGHQPRVADGMKQTINWFREQGVV